MYAIEFLSKFLDTNIVSVIIDYITYPRIFYQAFYTQCIRQIECITHPTKISEILNSKPNNIHHAFITDCVLKLFKRKYKMNINITDMIKMYSSVFDNMMNQMFHKFSNIDMFDKILITNVMYEFISKKKFKWHNIIVVDNGESTYPSLKSNYYSLLPENVGLSLLAKTRLGIQWYKSYEEMQTLVTTIINYS